MGFKIGDVLFFKNRRTGICILSYNSYDYSKNRAMRNEYDLIRAYVLLRKRTVYEKGNGKLDVKNGDIVEFSFDGSNKTIIADGYNNEDLKGLAVKIERPVKYQVIEFRRAR